MRKRPLNPQFLEAVLRGEKTTTIRAKPWPVGVPIMLYCWSGAAYRSPQADVCAVVVTETRSMAITHTENGVMLYDFSGDDLERPLHETEGFASAEAMDAWFRPLVKPGQTITSALMRFRRA